MLVPEIFFEIYKYFEEDEVLNQQLMDRRQYDFIVPDYCEAQKISKIFFHIFFEKNNFLGCESTNVLGISTAGLGRPLFKFIDSRFWPV